MLLAIPLLLIFQGYNIFRVIGSISFALREANLRDSILGHLFSFDDAVILLQALQGGILISCGATITFSFLSKLYRENYSLTSQFFSNHFFRRENLWNSMVIHRRTPCIGTNNNCPHEVVLASWNCWRYSWNVAMGNNGTRSV